MIILYLLMGVFHVCQWKVNKVRKGIVLLKSDTKLDIYFIFAPDLKYRLKR